jgi:hypothetical protein
MVELRKTSVTASPFYRLIVKADQIKPEERIQLPYWLSLRPLLQT